MDSEDCRFEEDFSDGRVLGGVDVPPPVLTVELERMLGAPDESLDRWLWDFSVLKLPLEKRRRSLRKEGIPVLNQQLSSQSNDRPVKE